MTTIKIALKAIFNEKAEWCELEGAHGTHAVVKRGNVVTSIDYRQIEDELIYLDIGGEEVAETASIRMRMYVPNGQG